MENIYEEIYQHLIDRGIEDEVATNFVNEMYDKEKYHGVEVLDEGVLRGLGAAARFLGRLSKTRVGRAGMFGTGAAGLGYAGYLADRPKKKLRNLRLLKLNLLPKLNLLLILHQQHQRMIQLLIKNHLQFLIITFN